MADLNQGIMFKNYIQQHKKKTNCKSLKLISSGKLNIVNNLKQQFSYSTIKESFASQMPVENPVEAKNLAELNQLSALEMQFNNDMADYTNTRSI